MKNKVLIMMTILAVLGFSSGVQAALVTADESVFSDDFNAYPAGDPADFSATGNWVHNGNGSGSNASRIYDTGIYDDSALWIASAANAAAGTGINSLAAIPMVSGTDYIFSGAIVAETGDPTRTADFTVDLLIGGVSQIGGPLAGTARGDGDGTIGVFGTYDDQMTIINFTPTTTGNLEIRIAFTGADTSNPFVGVDEVSIAQIPAFGIDESDESTDMAENAGSDTYDLLLLGDPNYPTSTVTVELTPDAQVAVTGASSVGTSTTWDLVSTPQTVTFPASSTDPNDYTVTLTVEGVDDEDIEGDHTGTITHVSSSVDSGWDAKAIPDVIVNITDDDGDPNIFIDATVLWVGEGFDPNDTYTLVLGKPPVTGQTVTVTPNTGTQLNAVPSSVVFTPADWNTPQTITIEAADDAVVEGTHFATVTHTVASGDPEYTVLTVPDLPTTIGDNEAQGPAGIISTPVAWYNENSTVNSENAALAADGEEISLWEDQSGSRRYVAYRYDGWTYPVFDAATNSARFDGTASIMGDNNWPEEAQPRTIFCVGTIDSHDAIGGGTEVKYFYDSYALAGSTARHVLNANTSGQWEIGAGVWEQTSDWYYGAPVLNTIVYNTTTSLHRVNGLQVFAGDLGTQGMAGISIGSGYWGWNWLIGTVSEIIVYNEALSPADIEAVEEYLIAKWTGRIGIAETGGTTEVNEVVDPNTDTYQVMVYGTPTQPVDVTITPTGANAGAVDLGLGSGTAITLNLPATATATATSAAHTVTVAADYDAGSTGPREVTLTHASSSADTDYNAQAIQDVVVTVNDNEAYCGDESTVYYPADLNFDCVVSLPDFAILAASWLDCTNPGDPGCD